MARFWIIAALLAVTAGCNSAADRYQRAVEEYQTEAELLASMEAELDSMRFTVRTPDAFAARERHASNVRAQWKKVVAAKLRVDRLAGKLPAEEAVQ
jgi:hypothetical protein